MIKVAILIIISFCLGTCTTHSKKIVSFRSTGLDDENLQFQTMVFSNPDTGFIGGSSEKVTGNPDTQSNQFATLERTALLYKTTNGGSTWRKKISMQIHE